MKKVINGLLVIALSFACITFLNKCKKADIDVNTTSDLNIYPYLQANTQFSQWAKIVDKSGYAGFLTAYGAYTMFAPTDDAVNLYLKDVSKSSVDDFTEAEAKDLVKFHLIQDTLATNTFKDGKLPTITMYGQYLVVATTNTGGISSITINRQAIITQGNIKTGNGLIHALDHVLKPATKSTSQMVSDNANLSIFKQALVATGYYDTLDKISTTTPKTFYTLIAESDATLASAGYPSYTALFNRFSNTGNPKNPLDSLHIFVAYHIMTDAKYLADIASASSHTTLQPLEVLSASTSGDKVILNNLTINGITEPGSILDRATSDVSTTTGVLHTALSDFYPKFRPPFPVYWDVADFPEIRKISGVFRKSGTLDFAYGTIKDITWEKPAQTLGGGGSGYVFAGTTNATYPVAYGDYLNIGLGGTGSRNLWIEFRTPLLVKGRYNIWVCYRSAKQSTGSFVPVNVYFDGQLTDRTFAFTTSRPFGTDGELLALGWKRYGVDSTNNGNATATAGKLVGTVTVSTTDRHLIRLEGNAAAGTGQNTNNLDMIHFIPVDWPSQFLPRFQPDGTPVYK